jgi:hypothetical protein
MVEEAGQVLEAHILASLVPSGTSMLPRLGCGWKAYLINAVQHLICIGDPQQLRPNVSTFSESQLCLVMQS